MARISGKDIYLDNDDQIYFGDNQEAAIWYDVDGELHLNHTISGVAATAEYHLIRKDQADYLIDTVSSGIVMAVFHPGNMTSHVSGQPGIGTAGPIIGFLYDDSSTERTFGTFVVPPKYKSGTDIDVNISYMTSSAQTGVTNVVWRLRYYTFEDTNTYASKVYTDKSISSTLPNNCVAGYFKVDSFASMTYNDSNNPFSAGTTVTFVLERLGSNINDTAIDDIAMIVLRFTIQTEVGL